MTPNNELTGKQPARLAELDAPNNEPSTAGATCTICGNRAVCITQMLGNIYPRCSDHPYTEEPGAAGTLNQAVHDLRIALRECLELEPSKNTIWYERMEKLLESTALWEEATISAAGAVSTETGNFKQARPYLQPQVQLSVIETVEAGIQTIKWMVSEYEKKIAASTEATAKLQARIKELDERPVRFMVEGGPVVMAADYEKLQAKLAMARKAVEDLTDWHDLAVEHAHAELEKAQAEVKALKAHLSIQPTSMEEITFREALRSEVIVITLKENEELKHVLAAERAQNEGLRKALTKIRRLPVMPFPDPQAHTWQAFAKAVHRSWCDIQRVAEQALLSAPAPAQAPEVKQD